MDDKRKYALLLLILSISATVPLLRNSIYSKYYFLIVFVGCVGILLIWMAVKFRK